MPVPPAINNAIIRLSCGGNTLPNKCKYETPNNAPINIIPSNAILITPLRSENNPAKATISKGIAKVHVC